MLQATQALAAAGPPGRRPLPGGGARLQQSRRRRGRGGWPDRPGTPGRGAYPDNLDGYNYGARAWAVRALAGIGDVRGLEVLEDALAQDIGPSVRRAAARGLGQLQMQGWRKPPRTALGSVACGPWRRAAATANGWCATPWWWAWNPWPPGCTPRRSFGHGCARRWRASGRALPRPRPWCDCGRSRPCTVWRRGMAEPRLLFVCLGNICRSPAAEGVFLHLLAREGLEQAFVVDSAGTGGWHVGRQADPRMRAAAARRGIALPSRARQIERADLERFDRILTMDEDNLRAVQSLARAGRQKSERTDAEATDGNGAAHPGALVEPITNHCRRFRAREVPDPYYGGEEGFEQVLDLLEDACSGLLEDLRASLD